MCAMTLSILKIYRPRLLKVLIRGRVASRAGVHRGECEVSTYCVSQKKPAKLFKLELYQIC